MKFITVLLFLSLLTFAMLDSRTSRVNQIPNGTINSCLNCHNTATEGGPRNTFGVEIENNFINAGTVVWNSELAALDSDGDGFTNGEELQDPLGTWRSGNPAPGNPAFVSNPGNSNSVPNTTKAEDYAFKSGFSFSSITPNPTNGDTKVSFSLSNEGNIEIDVYDANGKLIKKLFNGVMESGVHSVCLNIDGNINSGNYYLNIRFNGFSWIEKLNILR